MNPGRWASRMLARALRRRLIPRALERKPDLTVGGPDRPYLRRWWLVPRNRFLNLYVHQFLRSDDDRALHDHPWFSLSLALHGRCTEHTIAAGGIHARRIIRAGDWRWRGPRFAHRIELDANPDPASLHGSWACWTLFLTGPRLREWGFHCQERGWVHHTIFSDPADPGAIGRGCD